MIAVERKTSETEIRVEIAIGEGRATIETGVQFLDHMLTALARYSGLDLTISAKGDLRHHLIEDVGLTLGEAVRRVLPAARPPWNTSMNTASTRARTQSGARVCMSALINEMKTIHAAPDTQLLLPVVG